MTDEGRATLEDLEQARAAVLQWDDAWANDSSNNPNKHHSQRQSARRRVRDLTARLKAQGDIEMPEHERLCAALDALSPNARSGQIVAHGDARYRRRFFPEEKSRTGKSVTVWGRTWEKV